MLGEAINPLGVNGTAPLGAPAVFRLAEDTGVLVLIAEIDAYRPGAVGTPLAEPMGALPMLAITPQPQTLDDFQTIRASDSGYVTRANDPLGLQVYPPILSSGVEVDRAMELEPGGQGAAAGWGSIRLTDLAQVAPLAATRNVDGRPIRIRAGRRTLLPHGVWRDPAWAETTELLVGLGAGWTLTEQELEVRLRDPGYWLERQVDGSAYAGTGGLEGSAALAGKRKPKLRGGDASAPVREIPPVLVDQTSGIYQVSDSFGAIVTLYERGATTITNAGQVGDITAVTPAAGTFRWESSARGLFVRLGTFPPAGQITVDAWGAFPDGQAPSTGPAIALQFMLQDLGVPASAIDAGSFTGLGAAFPFPSGVWLPDEQQTGRDVVGLLVASACGRVVPRRNGRLAAVGITAIGAGGVAVPSYSTAQIVGCAPVQLGAPMDPPPFRIRVGHTRFQATQSSDLAPTLSGARRQDLAEPWRVSTASQASVLTAWRRPSDPPIVETALTSAAGAAALATALRDLWCVPEGRRLYEVRLPLGYAGRQDVGDAIQVTYPGELAAGRLGRVVGEQIRVSDSLVILQVLV